MIGISREKSHSLGYLGIAAVVVVEQAHGGFGENCGGRDGDER